jgi:hypothetical protein
MLHRVPGLVLAFCVASSGAMAHSARVVPLPNDDGYSSSQKVHQIGFTRDDNYSIHVVSALPSESNATSVRQNVRRAKSGNDTSPPDQVVTAK